MAIRLGTIGAFGFDEFPPHLTLPCYRDLGAKTIQAFRRHGSGVSAETISTLCRKLELHIRAIHASFEAPLDLTAPDRQVRRETLATLAEDAAWAERMQARFMVVHPSPPFEDTSRLPDPRDEHDRAQRFPDCLKALLPIAEKHHLTLLIENMPPYHPFGRRIVDMATLVRHFDSPHIRLCLDTGHLNIVGSPLPQIEKVLDLVCDVHLSDNDGTSDDHLLPFKGTFPWDAFAELLHRRNYTGSLTMEIFFTPEQLRAQFTDPYRRKIHSLLVPETT